MREVGGVEEENEENEREYGEGFGEWRLGSLIYWKRLNYRAIRSTSAIEEVRANDETLASATIW